MKVLKEAFTILDLLCWSPCLPSMDPMNYSHSALLLNFLVENSRYQSATRPLPRGGGVGGERCEQREPEKRERNIHGRGRPRFDRRQRGHTRGGGGGDWFLICIGVWMSTPTRTRKKARVCHTWKEKEGWMGGAAWCHKIAGGGGRLGLSWPVRRPKGGSGKRQCS